MNEVEVKDSSNWFPLLTKEDYAKIPSKKNFRCLLDDGSECNYWDDLPLAIITHWKPL